MFHSTAFLFSAHTKTHQHQRLPSHTFLSAPAHRSSCKYSLSHIPPCFIMPPAVFLFSKILRLSRTALAYSHSALTAGEALSWCQLTGSNSCIDCMMDRVRACMRSWFLKDLTAWMHTWILNAVTACLLDCLLARYFACWPLACLHACELAS